MLASCVIHAAMAGSAYLGFASRKGAPIIAELDLSMAPLVSAAVNQGGHRSFKPAESWTLPKKGNAPLPSPVPVQETKEEVLKQENQEVPCADPCPQNGAGIAGGVFIPASQAARKPRWIKNFIAPQDYPAVARQEGKDGRVVISVWIDSEGRVQDARLLQGSYGALNEAALRKVREAVFSPAYNSDGQPVACKVTLPIQFELR